MQSTNTLIIGAGQCGLTMAKALSDRGVDHLVLDGGRIAERWHTERWDSLRMLTPNWLNSLDGEAPKGFDPDGFMSAGEMAQVMNDFASANSIEVKEETKVLSLRCSGIGYVVQTDQGAISAENVVIATGACAVPNIPNFSQDLGCYQMSSPVSYTHLTLPTTSRV